MIELGNIKVSSGSRKATVVASGSLDLHIEQEFKKALAEATGSGREVIVDFRSVTYIDTAILAALVTASRALSEVKQRLRILVAEGGHPQYALKITGFDGFMDVEARSSAIADE